MKFKIGDRVKLIRKDSLLWVDQVEGIVEGFDKQGSRWFVKLYNQEYYFLESDLELVENEKDYFIEGLIG
jgi:hypothetical protein